MRELMDEIYQVILERSDLLSGIARLTESCPF